MTDWTSTHDAAYAFLCVGFLADGAVDQDEIGAIRGNAKVLFPSMTDKDFDVVMDAAVARFVSLETDGRRREHYATSLAGVKQLLATDEERFRFIKNLAYIVRADKAVHDREVEMVEEAVKALDMTAKVTLKRTDTSLFVDLT